MTRVTKDFDTSKFTGILLGCNSNYHITEPYKVTNLERVLRTEKGNYNIIEPYNGISIVSFGNDYSFRFIPSLRRDWFFMVDSVYKFFESSIVDLWEPHDKIFDADLTLYEGGKEKFTLSLSAHKQELVLLAGLMADLVVHLAAIVHDQPRLKYLELGKNYQFINGNCFKGEVPQNIQTYTYTIQFESCVPGESYVIARMAKTSEFSSYYLYGYTKSDEGYYVHGRVFDGKNGFVVASGSKILLFTQDYSYQEPEEADLTLIEASDLSAEDVDAIFES